MKKEPRKIAVKLIRSVKKIQVKVFSMAKTAMSFELTKLRSYHSQPIGGSKRADTILAVNITLVTIIILSIVFMYFMKQGAQGS